MAALNLLLRSANTVSRVAYSRSMREKDEICRFIELIGSGEERTGGKPARKHSYNGATGEAALTATSS
jgi:hypothetical protein